MNSIKIAAFSLLGLSGIACQSTETTPSINLDAVQDSTNILFSVEDLKGPEAVRFDEKTNSFYISNFNGGGNDADANGFITKVDANGTLVDMEYMTGTDSYPLHAPRGMFIQNEQLWVADVFGVHTFDINTGTHLNFIDFSGFEPGFLNDISGDGSGTLYVTDTGKPVVYKIEDQTATVFLDSLLVYPNGITYLAEEELFTLAPWRGDTTFYAFDVSGMVTEFTSSKGGNFDGIEPFEDYLIIASQVDQSIRINRSELDQVLINTPGRPADIGLDTRNLIIAVPYIALDRVDFWSLSSTRN